MSELRIVDAPAGTDGDTVVLKFVGTRLDAVSARDLRSVAVDAASKRRLVVVVLEEVVFIDSTGLGCLVAMLKAVASGGQVRLVRVQPAVRGLLALTRLDRVFRAFDDVEAAVAS